MRIHCVTKVLHIFSVSLNHDWQIQCWFVVAKSVRALSKDELCSEIRGSSLTVDQFLFNIFFKVELAIFKFKKELVWGGGGAREDSSDGKSARQEKTGSEEARSNPTAAEANKKKGIRRMVY